MDGNLLEGSDIVCTSISQILTFALYNLNLVSFVAVSLTGVENNKAGISCEFGINGLSPNCYHSGQEILPRVSV